MSVKRLPKVVDCDRIWADLVTIIYRLRRKPRVTYFVPALPLEVASNKPKSELSESPTPE